MKKFEIYYLILDQSKIMSKKGAFFGDIQKSDDNFLCELDSSLERSI